MRRGPWGDPGARPAGRAGGRPGWRGRCGRWPCSAFAVVAWLDHLLRQAGRPELAWLTRQPSPIVLAVVSAATVGAVLASRRPRHPVGWLLLALGLSLAASGVAPGTPPTGCWPGPGRCRPPATLAGFANGASVLVWPACVGFVLLLTPTGSLPSPRWRWWARVAAAAPVVALLAGASSPGRWTRSTRSVANPLGRPGPGRAAAGRRQRSPWSSPAGLLVAAPPRWWCAFAAPAGSSASSCAGWRWRRRCRRRRWWWPWSAWLAGRRHPARGGRRRLCGAAAGGDRRGDPALSAVRPGPDHQPHPGLRAAHGAAGRRLRRGGAGAGPAPAAATPAWSWPGRPWPWRRRSSRPAAASSRWWTGASTAAATTPPRRSGVQRPAARAGRPGHPDRRAAGRGRPDDAANPGVAVAAATAGSGRSGWRRRGPATQLKAATGANRGPPGPVDLRPWSCRATLRGDQGSSDCRRRRRGPQVRQERGRADESIARSAPLGLAAPLPRGGPVGRGFCGRLAPRGGTDQR